MKANLENLHDLTWGYRAARLLQVANKIDLFTNLGDKALTLTELCDACRTKPDMTQKILIAAAALGLITRQGHLYKNTEAARTYLVKGSKLYQGDIIAHSDAVRAFWDNLEDAVCLEPITPDPSATHHSFIMAMHNITMASRGKIFQENVDFSGKNRLLDVGGGPGAYSILACRDNPSLHAVIFDLPETIAIARRVVAAENLSDRISFVEGDWQKDPFGKNFDAVLMSNIMHGPDSMAQMKMEKAFTAMLPGGILAVQEFLLNNDKTGPLTAALFNIMVGAYAAEELISLIRNAGFVEPKLVFNDENVGAGWVVAKKQR